MRIMLIAIVVTLLSIVCSTLAARDLFVNNVSGRDVHNGHSPEITSRQNGPCRTISRALRGAEKGDRIVLANTGVPYRECVTLQAGRHSGTPNRPFEIIGNGAVLEGFQPVNKEAWEHVEGDVFRYLPRRQSYQQLFHEGRPLVRAAITEEWQMPELQPLEWCLFDRHVYFRVERDRLPHQYEIYEAGHPVGITLYDVRNVVISDLVVQGFQLDGINAHDTAENVLLIGLTVRGNGRSGISVGGASRVRITACLLGSNGAAQIRSEGWSITEILNCDVVEASAPAVTRQGVGARVFINEVPMEGEQATVPPPAGQ